MTIVQRMRAALKESMKARDAVRTNFLRYWIAQLTLGTGEEMELIRSRSCCTGGTGFTGMSTAMSARARIARNATLTASTSRYTLRSRRPYSRRLDSTWFTCR